MANQCEVSIRKQLARMEINNMKIAIVGTGISGLSTAWHLDQKHDITLYEKNSVAGGHAHTLEVQYQETTIPVNTAYDIFSPVSYPDYTAFLEELGVLYEPIEFAFTFTRKKGPQGSCEQQMLFPPLLNLRNARQLTKINYLILTAQSVRINSKISTFNKHHNYDATFGEFLRNIGIREYDLQHFFLPVLARPWGVLPKDMEDFPANIVLNWLKQHKIFTARPVKWYTISNGVQRYIDSVTAKLLKRGVTLLRKCPVKKIEKQGSLYKIYSGQNVKYYDHVVLATDVQAANTLTQNLQLGIESSLDCFKIQTNHVLVHHDQRLMPKNPKNWSYFNVEYCPVKRDSIDTVWFGKKMGLPVFLTNFRQLDTYPEASKIYAEFKYQQPIFSIENNASRARVMSLQGQNNVWFAGAYLGEGHHEDGFKLGCSIAKKINQECGGAISLPIFRCPIITPRAQSLNEGVTCSNIISGH